MFGSFYAGSFYAGQSGIPSANAVILLVDNANHDQTTTTPSLTQVHNLTTADTLHDNTADSTHLVYVSNALHSQTAGEPVIFLIERIRPTEWSENSTETAQEWANTGEKVPDEWINTPEQQAAYWRDSFSD